MLYTTRSNQPRGRARQVEWRLPRWAYNRFLELMDTIDSLDPKDSTLEALHEQVRALPGFPRYYDPDRDLIVPTVTTTRTL